MRPSSLTRSFVFSLVLFASPFSLSVIYAQTPELPESYFHNGSEYPYFEIAKLLEDYFPTSASFGLGSFPDTPGRIATIATLGRGDVPMCGGVPGNTRGWFPEIPPSSTHLGLMNWQDFGYFRLVAAPCVDISTAEVVNNVVCDSFFFSFCTALIIGQVRQSDPDWLGNSHPYIFADKIVYLENEGVMTYLFKFLVENPDIINVN